MNNIPTFEELAHQEGWRNGDQLDISDMATLSRYITSLHVEAALKAAVLNGYCKNIGPEGGNEYDSFEIDKDSILSSYPLENIK